MTGWHQRDIPMRSPRVHCSRDERTWLKPCPLSENDLGEH
jgi:hypothetical protein